MRIAVALVAVAIITGCATAPDKSSVVALEFRPASLTPGQGLIEMTVVGTSQRIYVTAQAVITNADVASARVVEGKTGPMVEIMLTPLGTDKLARVTEALKGNPLGILVDGQLITAPMVPHRIASGKAMIAGQFSEADARRLARGIVLSTP